MLAKYEVFWHLFIGFVKPGLFGFGGGPASIPFIEKEVVDHYKWMTEEEFLDVLALGNSLPGPITTKLAAIVGYNVAGIPGMLVAISGMVFPTAILVVILTSVYLKYKNIPKVEGIIEILRVIVVVLLLQVTWELGVKSVTNYMTIGIFVAAFICLFVFKLNPVLVIILGVIFGLLFA